MMAIIGENMGRNKLRLVNILGATTSAPIITVLSKRKWNALLMVRSKPQNNRRANDGGSTEINGSSDFEGKVEMNKQVNAGNAGKGDGTFVSHLMVKKDQVVAHEQSSVSSEDEEAGDDTGITGDDGDDNERDAKRRQLRHAEQLQNLVSLCRLQVKLIYSMMVIDGASMGRKL